MQGSVAATVAAVTGRLILDSHLGWTPEFDVHVDGGRVGRGSAPRGETVSIFEAPVAATGTKAFAAANARLQGRTFTLEEFDRVARELGREWGSQVTMALSSAFYLATLPEGGDEARRPPRLLLNMLNGGLHAYTNPITADVPEIMLLAHSDDLARVADAYVGLLQVAHARLRTIPMVEVGGNPVHGLGAAPNEAVLALLGTLLKSEGLESLFGIAVDASAGDWATADGYRLPVSGREHSTESLARWWLDLVDEYAIELLEDPFSEVDRAGWRDLLARRPVSCRILGDNYTSTDVEQLASEGKAADVDGVLVKPDQNGTVSGTLAFAAAARAAGLLVVSSHRSVETESTMLIRLSLDMRADAIKIGPFRDFTAVVKFNELLRVASA